MNREQWEEHLADLRDTPHEHTDEISPAMRAELAEQRVEQIARELCKAIGYDHATWADRLLEIAKVFELHAAGDRAVMTRNSAMRESTKLRRRVDDMGRQLGRLRALVADVAEEVYGEQGRGVIGDLEVYERLAQAAGLDDEGRSARTRAAIRRERLDG